MEKAWRTREPLRVPFHNIEKVYGEVEREKKDINAASLKAFKKMLSINFLKMKLFFCTLKSSGFRNLKTLRKLKSGATLY